MVRVHSLGSESHLLSVAVLGECRTLEELLEILQRSEIPLGARARDFAGQDARNLSPGICRKEHDYSVAGTP